MYLDRSISESNLHAPFVFLSISKIGYTLIMLTPKFCSFLSVFTSCRTILYIHTVLTINVYYNDQNIIYFYKILVQMTAFGFVRVSCLRASKLIPHWYQNITNASTPCSPAFYHFFKLKLIYFIDQYETYMRSIFFWKKYRKATKETAPNDE